MKTTSIYKIKEWLLKGMNKGAKYVIIATDTFDHSDYPIYCYTRREVIEEIAKVKTAKMQKIMEVYNLLQDITAQLSEYRAYHI